MDGFDDLLDKSQAELTLDNPFDDPFARPRSPDPWLTYSRQPFQDELHTPMPEPEEPFHDTEREKTTTPTGDKPSTPEPTVDPLDAKAANEGDDDPVASQLSKPLRSEDVQVQTAAFSTLPSPSERESEPVKGQQALEVASPTPQESSGSPPPSPKEKPKSEVPPSVKVSQESKPSLPVVSPLHNAPANGESSFGTLALGGEMPGWSAPSSQPSFIPNNEWSESNNWGTEEKNKGFVSVPLKQEGSDDDDDDVPIAHRVLAVKAAAGGDPTSKTSKPSEIHPMFVITVGDPQKVGDPVRPYITYTVSTRTTSPLYRRSSFSVLRRYSDFLWLYETLSLNNPGVIVPPVPEKQQYGRFEDTFVEHRRVALNQCIQKMANHPALCNDPDLKLFLESDTFTYDIKQRKAEMAYEKGGLMATIGNSLVGPRFYETDEWFDHKKAYLDTMESQLRGLVKTIDVVSKQRHELALSMTDFADNISALAECDMSKQLSQTLSVLSDIQRKAKEFQEIQAREDVSTVMCTVEEYARLVNSVRHAFSSRVRLWSALQNAESDLRKVQQAHGKARRQGRIASDRIGTSLSEIAEAERRAIDAKQEFEAASKTIKKELARFEQERVEDFKNSLVSFVDGMITRQKEIIKSWETYQESLLSRLSNPAAKPSIPAPS